MLLRATGSRAGLKIALDIYRPLNRITAPGIVQLLEENGFEILGDHRECEDHPIPAKLLLAYKEDVLRTQSVAIVARLAADPGSASISPPPEPPSPETAPPQGEEEEEPARPPASPAALPLQASSQAERPDAPVIRFDAARPLRFRRAWEDILSGFGHWRLAWALARGDITERYRGSVLGPIWMTLSTALMLTLLGFLYSKLFRMDLEAYLPWLSAGLVIWGVIGQCVADACTCMTSISRGGRIVDDVAIGAARIAD